MRVSKAMGVRAMLGLGDDFEAVAPAIAPAAVLRPVALVACSAGKLGRRAPASALYTSDLFAKSRAYAEQLGGPWFILSAQYGALRPSTLVSPYNLKLDELAPVDRAAWARRVFDELVREGIAGRRVVMLAGELYRRDLAPLLASIGCTIETPLAGLGIGYQKQWLARAVEGNQ